MVQWWKWIYRLTCINIFHANGAYFLSAQHAFLHEQTIHHDRISLSLSFVAKGKETVIYSLNKTPLQMQPSLWQGHWVKLNSEGEKAADSFSLFTEDSALVSHCSLYLSLYKTRMKSWLILYCTYEEKKLTLWPEASALGSVVLVSYTYLTNKAESHIGSFSCFRFLLLWRLPSHF